VDERRGGNQRVPDGAWIGDVEGGAAPRDGDIDGQDAFVEGGQDVILELLH
jgi:hypothetical protein